MLMVLLIAISSIVSIDRFGVKGIMVNGVRRSMVVPIPVSHCGCWVIHA